LAALRECRLAIGRWTGSTVEPAVQQAHALRHAWDLHTLDLSAGANGVQDLSALAGCATLHTLDIRRTNVVDVSALGNLVKLVR